MEHRKQSRRGTHRHRPHSRDRHQHAGQRRNQQQQQQQQQERQQQGRSSNRSRRRRRGGYRRPSEQTVQAVAASGRIEEAGGILDVLPAGSGFLRKVQNDLFADSQDVYFPAQFIRQKGLISGMLLSVRAAVNQNKRVATEILTINGVEAEKYVPCDPFERQLSIDPEERFQLTPAPNGRSELSMRFIELMTPIGMGQRSVIVAPPRTGKTTLLQELAASVAHHHPDVHVIALLIDERPEEVTHFKRMVRGDVIASSSDKEAASHLHVARLTLDIARNLAACGKNVFLVLDSLTRLARASNAEQRTPGRTLTGGVAARALEFPRRFFGSARKLENGGSLTIVATVLVDTGSRMDEVIFQEFKGTGNMELVLDRNIAERRIFPAVDLRQSGTRKEEKILPPAWLTASYKLRRHLGTLKPEDALDVLLERLAKAESLESFCKALA